MIFSLLLAVCFQVDQPCLIQPGAMLMWDYHESNVQFKVWRTAGRPWLRRVLIANQPVALVRRWKPRKPWKVITVCIEPLVEGGQKACIELGPWE